MLLLVIGWYVKHMLASAPNRAPDRSEHPHDSPAEDIAGGQR
jgi:hypothetical protein